MVVFKDDTGKTVKVFSSSLDGLGELYAEGIITEAGFEKLEEFINGKTLVGFNNYWYDDYILYAMSKNFDQWIIKEWNDSIIKQGSMLNMKKIECCKTLDCFQQIDVSRPSLKKIEGNMGLSIVESSVSFDIDRPLTPSENYETFKYCEYDVLNTWKIFRMRKDYFESKNKIIDMMESDHLKKIAYKWNTTSIVGEILKPKRKAPSRRLVGDHLMEYAPKEVRDMWEQLDTTIDFKFKKKKVVIEEFGNVIEFGWGGLHGAPKRFITDADVKLADVSSMYPNILILLDGLKDKTKYYKDILDYRLKLKHEGKKEEQAPLKLVLNSTYGILNNKFSQLNNPHLAYSICIYGQISLYVLSQRLAQMGARIININTDGVAYSYTGDEDIKIFKNWEEEFGLNLEIDRFSNWIQSNVNNYIAVTKSGYMVTKGSDVNKYNEHKYFANNDIRITHIALVDYLIHGKPVQDTLFENLNDPVLYQYILKAGNTYKGVVRSDEPEKLLDTTTNRIFAAKGEGVEILKKRQDDGLVKFADAPNKMFLWNEDLKDLKDFEKIIDLQWYYDLVMKNLERWR
ncbi:hypothetical protein [Microaceticoccus formicicus]|uniref:hypothetical protein n=1 Tax=Microaceticoccus formicicus TaxID=3118105 RepID=UPI003CD0026E|nr:hypothetical protein VZL98_01540 [Peptoniphilaceae bacterium AMB_02]